MLKPFYLMTFLLFTHVFLFSQKMSVDRIEPPFWWTEMHDHELQIMLYGKDLGNASVSCDNQLIRIKSVETVENKNYLFVNLVLEEGIQPGKYSFILTKNKKEIPFEYELKKRDENSAQRKSYDASDVIYLLMPDRFANGDENNDSTPDTKEKHNRAYKGGRHGGDIQGMIDRLPYLAEMGVTALWPTPLLLDDEEKYSYHGYAAADYYKIDPRYGTNELYKKLADECHKNGIKLIKDYVTNHCGISHWWMNDLPMKDWVHQYPSFTRTNYRMSTWNDPYTSDFDLQLNNRGWFDHTMPDLDQSNPYLLTYLKQNAIWWIEYAGLDGLRIDTYPYNDKWHIAQWTKAIRDEYPNINIVGECWQHRPSEIAYWQSGTVNFDGYDSYLPSVMDFCLTDQLFEAFNEADQGWDKGVARIYYSLVTDYVYANPYNLMVMLDNHDITRYSESVKNDVDNYKLALSFLLTTRGIPQIYYGTEIMMEGSKSQGDGDIRRDFPGGWKNDAKNAFVREGRSPKENEVFDHISTLLNWRRNNPVIHFGKMMHFVPEDNMYVYFRYDEQKKVMVIINNNKESKKIKTARFKEMIEGYSQGHDILTGKMVVLQPEIDIEGKKALILELTKAL